MKSRVLRFCVAMVAAAGLSALVAPAASAAPLTGPIHRVPDDLCQSRTDFLTITSNDAPGRAVCFADSGDLPVYIDEAVCVDSGLNHIYISSWTRGLRCD